MQIFQFLIRLDFNFVLLTIDYIEFYFSLPKPVAKAGENVRVTIEK